MDRETPEDRIKKFQAELEAKGEEWRCASCGEENGPMRQTCRLCGAERSYSDSFKEKLILTTAPSIEGYKVAETLEIVTAECVFGVNVFRDFFGGISDFFGGRSAATQKVLRKARRVCLNELNKEAALVGADAVIAVKLDYSEFSGKGKSMLFLVASGTAVKIEKITEGTRAVKHG